MLLFFDEPCQTFDIVIVPIIAIGVGVLRGFLELCKRCCDVRSIVKEIYWPVEERRHALISVSNTNDRAFRIVFNTKMVSFRLLLLFVLALSLADFIEFERGMLEVVGNPCEPILILRLNLMPIQLGIGMRRRLQVRLAGRFLHFEIRLLLLCFLRKSASISNDYALLFVLHAQFFHFRYEFILTHAA